MVFAERLRRFAGVVGGDQNPLGAVQPIARIPQTFDFVIQVRQSAVDVEVGFPEARRLPGHFVRLIALGAENRLLERLAEIAWQLGQQRQGDGDHGVVGI